MTDKHDIDSLQSIELLKALHILTRDGKLNQDSRRKLKQVNHLVQFIEPLLSEIHSQNESVHLVDHGAGKSYLGFILFDRFFSKLSDSSTIFGIETRDELVMKSRQLADQFGFGAMKFLNLAVADSVDSPLLPLRIDMVTALHACDTATDDAIRFALQRNVPYVVLIPCCQAEVAGILRKNKAAALSRGALAEIWRHPLHTREFGSMVTNTLRCLQLQSHGYHVTVTELVGWDHSMKNELIVAVQRHQSGRAALQRLTELLDMLGLAELHHRFILKSATAP